MVISRLLSRLLWPLVLFAVAGAQDPTPSTPAQPEPPSVYVIGASVSGGFEDGPLTGGVVQCRSAPLQTVLKAWLEPVDGKVRSFPLPAMQGLFLQPEATGAQEIKAAIKAKVGLVVGLDFPFWFGYGAAGGSDALEARLQKLEAGLALLDQLSGEVIVGDFPDMTGAAARMLAPSWIPSPRVLTALNQRLAAWVQQHQGKADQPGPRAHLFPLAQLVKTMKRDGVVVKLQDGELRCGPGDLQQADGLHANRLGMAYLGLMLQQFAKEQLPAGSVWHEPQLSLDDFVAACRAEDDVEALRAKAKTKAAPPAKTAPPVEQGKGGVWILPRR